MLRNVVAALALTVVTVAPLLAESPEPPHSAIVRAAQACTAEGAFGYRFGEKFRGDSPTRADPLWTPFEAVTISPTLNTGSIFEIEGSASFEKARMSREDRVTLADWVFHAIDAEVMASRRFAKREVRKDGVTYHSDADVKTGYVLDISHDEALVFIDCIDVNLKRQAWTAVR